MSLRYDDFDVIALGSRIAGLISYGQSKKEIVDRLRDEKFTDDQIVLGYGAAKLMIAAEEG